MKYILIIALIVIVGMGITLSVQRCTIKEQQKEIKELKVEIGNLKHEIEFAKWYIDIIKQIDSKTEGKINEINTTDKNKDLLNLANNYFSYGMHKNNLQNKTDKTNNP